MREDLLVELHGLVRLVRHVQLGEDVGKPLHADGDGAVAGVRRVRFLRGVRVHVDDRVEVADEDAHDALELVEVEVEPAV